MDVGMRKGSASARKGSVPGSRPVLPMCERRLRSNMKDMNTLLSQPFATAHSNAIVRAGFLRRLRAGK
ncbi:hypothetical protein DSM104299_03052 [Baekduia alba]|nr:hypothetical protein DSM104299_03052 [Baekduia alba]